MKPQTDAANGKFGVGRVKIKFAKRAGARDEVVREFIERRIPLVGI